jgi:hypothetical protein
VSEITGCEIQLLRCSGHIATIDTSPKRKRGKHRAGTNPRLRFGLMLCAPSSDCRNVKAIYFRIGNGNSTDKLGQRSSLSLLRSSSISVRNR